LPVLIEGRVVKIITSDANPMEINAMVISIKSHKKTYEELNNLSQLDQRRFSQNIFENNIGDLYYVEVQIIAKVYKNNEYDIFSDNK